MCIFCFLDNLNQYKLRNEIQLRNDRFEHTLDKFKFAYIEKFYFNLDKDLCVNHNFKENEKLKKKLKNIKKEDINNFFNNLIKCYLLWIDSQLFESQKLLEQTLNKYNILDLTKTLNSEILFRGRPSKTFLSHWDMFHIPFNRRFLISNQRYSLVGQPLLYLSTSPYCIYKELGVDTNVQISSFRLDNSPRNAICPNEVKNTCVQNYKCIQRSEYKCFDNTNHFYEYIISNESNNTINYKSKVIEEQHTFDNYIANKLNKVPITFSNSKATQLLNLNTLVKPIELKMKDVKKILFQHILCSCTSFKKSNKDDNSKFCEEYVLPQILAQLVKYKKFNGIIYTSTNAYDELDLCKNTSVYNYIFKNICLFTNYNQQYSSDVTYVYDKELYSNFLISSTIKKEDLNNDIIETLEKLSKIIKTTYDTEELTDYDSATFSEVEKYIKLYRDLLIIKNKNTTNDKNKTDTINNFIINQENKNLIDSAKLHTFLLRNIILNIKDNLLDLKLSRRNHNAS